MKRNYEVLEIGLRKIAELSAETADRIENWLPELVEMLNEGKSRSVFSALVNNQFSMVAATHLGIAEPKEAKVYGPQCVATAIEYFTSGWQLELPDGEPEEDRCCLLKEPGNGWLQWTDIFRRAFLMAILLGDDGAVSTMAEWTESWMRLDPSHDQDPLVAKVYLSVASSFQKTPFADLDEMENAILKGRAKSPKLLLQAWVAARANDPVAFGKFLTESVRHFEKTIGDLFLPEDYLALDQSLVLAAARERGMAIPEMEPRLLARLITRESIGIEATSGVPTK